MIFCLVYFIEEALKRAVLNEQAAFEKATAIIEQAKVEVDGDVVMSNVGDEKPAETGDDGNPNLPEISYKNPTMLLNEKRKGKIIIYIYYSWILFGIFYSQY